MILVASLCAAATIGCVMYLVSTPLPKLSSRLRPYDTVARVRLNGGAPMSTSVPRSTNVAIEFFRPVIEAFTHSIARFVVADKDNDLALRLQQAGFDTTPDEYRAGIIKRILIGIGVGLLIGALRQSVAALIFFPSILTVVAYSKTRSTIDKKIELRQRTIRAEMYTIDQLLALHIRTGSGVTQALHNITSRTHGVVTEEIGSILGRVRSGIPIEESLYIASRETPEPHAMRTYKLLAAASHRGVDLTQGLLDLAHDLRRSLREDIKASSAKRRAAMLLPTIGILAPIMLLFVAAPIPSIVLGN